MPDRPEPSPTPIETVLQVTTGVWAAQALWAAASLGIADLVARGPRTPAALAEATGTAERPLFRLLRSLACLGIFAEGEDGAFANSPASEFLRSDVPGSVRDYVVFCGQPWHLAAYGEILHSIRTGRPAIEKTHGRDVWAFLASDPEQAQIFNAGMTGVVAATACAVRDAYDFSGIGTLVDVGGGHGYLLGTVAAANPALRGILFDQPHVVDGAAPNLRRLGVADRVACVGGDFFREVPRGDAYVMSHIVHDWDDERAAAILRSVHAAAAPGARLLLVETVIPPGNAFSFGKILDLEMLCLAGGVERTEAEYRELLGVSGFRLARVLATPSSSQIIESVRV